MKTLFPEQFPISEEALKDIWSRGLMVFDTNTLLRLYRYKKSTSDEILKVWEGLGNRLWIPYQVAWEYNNNRDVKVKEARKSYTDIVSILSEAGQKVADKLVDLKDFGVHPKAGLEGDLESIARDILKKTQEVSSKYDASPAGDHYEYIHESIGNIFEGKIGDCPDDANLDNLYVSGQSRFENNTPPGLRDVADKRKKQRPDREVFGDYIIWRELLAKAKADGLPVIFVTEDAKDDWWLKEDNKTIGVLPQLRKEFLNEVGCDIHFYRIAFYLEQAKVRLLAEISSDSVEDVGRTEDSQSEPLELAESTDMEFAERISDLVRLHQLRSDENDEKDLLRIHLSRWTSQTTLAHYNMTRSAYADARAEYRKYSKVERSNSARGVGSPRILSTRAKYLNTKREFEQARHNFEKQMGLVQDYLSEAGEDE
jgi:predicted nucleic acid-binding protein